MNEGKFNPDRREGEEHSEIARQLNEIFPKCRTSVLAEGPGHQNILHYDLATIAKYFDIGPEQAALPAAGLRLESDVFGRTLVPVIKDSDKFVAVLESTASEARTEEFHRGIEQILTTQIARASKDTILLHVDMVRGWLGRLPESCEVEATSLRLERAQALDEFFLRQPDIFLAAQQRGVDAAILSRCAELATASRENVLLEYAAAREMGAFGHEEFVVKPIEFLDSGLTDTNPTLDKIIDRMRSLTPDGKTYKLLQERVIKTIEGRIQTCLQAQQATGKELTSDQRAQRQELFALIKLKKRYLEKFS